MTVYRHFPTKEDLVLVDQRDRLVAERIAASSAAQPWSAVSAPRSSTWPRR
jgi:AcrR family transcriptional regulator